MLTTTESDVKKAALPAKQMSDLSGITGLSDDEVKKRLLTDGPNELPSQKSRNIGRIALEVAKEPMFLMLVAAGILYLLMGEPADALMLLGFVFVVMGITITQERRTERALDALRNLSSPRALVIREGIQKRIPGSEVVCGDIVVISEGDRVPADAILRRSINLSVDESLLTGESVPVRKIPSDDAKVLDRPGGDDLPSIFSGTMITAGQGIAEVIATGVRSEIGKIGKALQTVELEPTLLQRETGRLVRTFAIVGLIACLLVVIAYGLTRGGSAEVWKEGLLAGITLAMATIPEEFPVVLTVFLALGAWRISRSNVLTRRMPAVETLGAATVLCVDKTGTLTMNQMTLRCLSVANSSIDLTTHSEPIPASENNLLETSILASKQDPFDPMERALLVAGEKFLTKREYLHQKLSLEREYPLSPTLLSVSHAWRINETDMAVIAAKGAPEAIAELCHLSPERRKLLEREVAVLASQGLRVLGVAKGCTTQKTSDLPINQHDLSLEFVGLLGLADPLRSTVPAAVAECRAAGIRVVMITGDYPATAQSIAKQAGLENAEVVITGPELEAMSPEVLAQRIKNVQIFARVVPEQKLRIVNALKANKEIVAMTGDGVNDAPALKAAHIGIAMGGRGTDVARESAALVLLDDDFSSIVAAVKLGRRIFDNIKKAIAFILAVHIPIAGLSIVPVFFSDWPLLLLPVHIVFLELIIDPACSLIFEAEDAEVNIMQRPPRDPEERLFSGSAIIVAVLQGLSVLAVCLGVFMIARNGHSIEMTRMLTFSSLVASFIAIILVNRSWVRSLPAMLLVKNSAVIWVVGGAIVLLVSILFVPAALNLFHFAPPHLSDLGISLAVGFSCVLWFDVVKIARRHSFFAAKKGEVV